MTAACDDCRQASAGVWGGYRARCLGCMARAIARSHAAFECWHPKGGGDAGEIRDMAARLLPTLTREQQRDAIHHWWDLDHPVEAPTT